jgi:hypothetical protein
MKNTVMSRNEMAVTRFGWQQRADGISDRRSESSEQHNHVGGSAPGGVCAFCIVPPPPPAAQRQFSASSPRL